MEQILLFGTFDWIWKGISKWIRKCKKCTSWIFPVLANNKTRNSKIKEYWRSRLCGWKVSEVKTFFFTKSPNFAETYNIPFDACQFFQEYWHQLPFSESMCCWCRVSVTDGDLVLPRVFFVLCSKETLIGHRNQTLFSWRVPGAVWWRLWSCLGRMQPMPHTAGLKQGEGSQLCQFVTCWLV